MTTALTLYCGPAPTLASLATAWNPDPAVLAGLALLAGAGVLWRRPAALAAAGVLFLAFVSPLCALTVALFAAREVHHMALTAIAAPLLALALPAGRSRRAWAGGAQAAVVAHLLFSWLWHLPAAYHWALASTAGYWLMQATLLGTAVWLWRGILSARMPGGVAILLALATTMQMGALGALLIFADTPLYAVHFATTDAFGLSPLEDQQLAGLILWVPAALPYLAAALWRLHGILRRDDPAEPAAEAR